MKFDPTALSSHSSRLSNFHERPLPERAALVAQWANLTAQEQATLLGLSGLQPGQADALVENVVGTFALPLAIAVNFQVNGRDVLVPMCTDERTLASRCSDAARLARAAGGFKCRVLSQEQHKRLYVLGLDDAGAAERSVQAGRAALLAEWARHDPAATGNAEIFVGQLHDASTAPSLWISLQLAGSGAEQPAGDTLAAACSALAALIADLTGGRVKTSPPSPLDDWSMLEAECAIPADVLAAPGEHSGASVSGAAVVESIVEAAALSRQDGFYAAVHNRDIMSAVEAVALATGNERAAPAALAHRYAASQGQEYTSLAEWQRAPDGGLHGRLRLPLAVRLLPAGAQSHPSAQITLKVLGVKSAGELAQIAAAAGLAGSFSGLLASASAGVGPRDESAQARRLAHAAGAEGDLVERVAAKLLAEREISLVRAQELVAQLAHDANSGAD